MNQTTLEEIKEAIAKILARKFGTCSCKPDGTCSVITAGDFSEEFTILIRHSVAVPRCGSDVGSSPLLAVSEAERKA